MMKSQKVVFRHSDPDVLGEVENPVQEVGKSLMLLLCVSYEIPRSLSEPGGGFCLFRCR